MNFIVRPRRGGKTHAAMTFLLSNWTAVLIVLNHQMKANLVDEYGTTDSIRKDLCDRIYTVDAFKNYGRYNHTNIRGRQILVDNIDMLLPHLLDTHEEITLVTGTGLML